MLEENRHYIKFFISQVVEVKGTARRFLTLAETHQLRIRIKRDYPKCNKTIVEVHISLYNGFKELTYPVNLLRKAMKRTLNEVENNYYPL
jgi:hypothetical protein